MTLSYHGGRSGITGTLTSDRDFWARWEHLSVKDISYNFSANGKIVAEIKGATVGNYIQTMTHAEWRDLRDPITKEKSQFYAEWRRSAVQPDDARLLIELE